MKHRVAVALVLLGSLAAVAAGAGAGGRRVPGQHLHDRRPVLPASASDRRRQLRRDLERAMGSDGAATASSPSATTPRGAPRGAEFQVNTLHDQSPDRCPRVAIGRRRQLRRGLGELGRTGRLGLGCLRPALRRLGRAAGRRVPGQHLHDRDSQYRRSRGLRRGRELRRGLGELRPGRQRLRRLRPALRRLGRPRAASSRSTPTRPAMQWRQVVASDAAGNFVVVWKSDGQDGSGRGVFGQRYDASGARAGAEFQVNTYTTGDQDRPRVASDAAGNFVVAWDERRAGRERLRASSRSATTPRARRAEASSGSTPTTAGDQYRPCRGLGRRGQLRRGLGELRAGRQRLGRLRPALRRLGRAAGGEFQVNTYTTGTSSTRRRGLGRRRQLRRGLGQRHAGRQRCGRLRPALRRAPAGGARGRPAPGVRRQRRPRGGRDGRRAAVLAEPERRRADLRRRRLELHGPAATGVSYSLPGRRRQSTARSPTARRRSAATATRCR